MTRVLKDLEIYSYGPTLHPLPHLTLTISDERGTSSMLETAKYIRAPYTIDAVQVTADNIEEVAKWAQADVRTDGKNKRYIRVRVQRPLSDRQTKAYVGDWVLFAGAGYKVYTNRAFQNSFQKAPEEVAV